jgi:K(+)-stimulated pyrophosphate-energized sodium pump
MVDYVTLAIGAGLLSLVFAFIFTRAILKLPQGNERMQSISAAIREGAMAYMNRQYRVIGLVAIILAVVLWMFVGANAALAFVFGALFSGIAGYIGMNVSVRANVRTAQAAHKGVNAALQVAFRGGAVSGLSVVGLALFGVAGFYYLFTRSLGLSLGEGVEAIVGFAFGASLISLFARVGGGIYTKAADVGADLVGKVEAGIPEDDPRNPAVIADNVGDNVGDCAGMGADLFETYAVTAIAAMLLGFLIFRAEEFIIYPLALGAVAIVASIIAIFFVRLPKNKNIMGGLYRGVIAASLLSLVGFWYVTDQIFGGREIDGISVVIRDVALADASALFLASMVGIIITFALIVITEYYTSTKYKPVKAVAKASETGAATNIIAGLAWGMRSTYLPILLISAGILVSFWLGGLYGIAVAAVAMLSTTGIIVSLDTYGPITDNAGGIAEMSELPADVRETTDALDAVGNTTKAVTKGYAIGSAALAALALFADYTHRVADVVQEMGGTALTFVIDNPAVLVGLFIGGLLPVLFSSYLMQAVGKAAFSVVQEVRRQFKEIPGIMDGTGKPQYGQCVDIVTKAALREMVVPGILAVTVPLAVGFILGPVALGGLLIGVIVSGLLIALQMANGGATWDNAKKYIELGNHGGKGSEAHKAAVVGDTVGDPYKDTAGPAINALIKVINTIALIFAALIVHNNIGII